MASPLLSVSVDDIRAAQDLLSGVVRPTPLEFSRALADRVGTDVYLKCENLQRAGSFKIRGAYTRMARLSDEEKARGVVAASPSRASCSASTSRSTCPSARRCPS
jgi:threonine dehydratase